MSLNFKAPDNFLLWSASSAELPDRIAVLIGRNGSGKSTLLSRLAQVLHASQRERGSETLQALGKIDPPGIGFTRIINIAFSAFDVFQLPDVDYRDRKQIVDDLERGVGRYHYCGLRTFPKRSAEQRESEISTACPLSHRISTGRSLSFSRQARARRRIWQDCRTHN